MHFLQGVEFNDELAAKEEQLGAQKGEPGFWASCVRVLDPTSLSTTRSVSVDSYLGIQDVHGLPHCFWQEEFRLPILEGASAA